MNNLPRSQWLGLRIPFQHDSRPLTPRHLLICRSLAEQKQLNRRPAKQKAWMFADVAVTFEVLGISANRNRESLAG